MCKLCDLLDRIHTTENIGYLSDRYKLCLLIDSCCKCLICQNTVLLTVQIPDRCTCHSRCHLPWENVAVMFHDADCDLISFFQMTACIAVCNKVQTLCCISCKDDFFFRICMNKITHNFSGIFICFCCCKAQRIEATKRICIAFFIKTLLCFNYNCRLLCCSCIVYINGFICL